MCVCIYIYYLDISKSRSQISGKFLTVLLESDENSWTALVRN